MDSLLYTERFDGGGQRAAFTPRQPDASFVGEEDWE